MEDGFLRQAHAVVRAEMEAVEAMRLRMDASFARAVETVLHAEGRVAVMGMGKSGLIGRKIAATMASTGTPAFFVHPGEALHGDLGMIKPADVALLLSHSGTTEEIVRILSFLEYRGNPIIAMTGKTDSTLARHAHVVLDVGVAHEACSNNLAPTSSTTCALVMGDALAVVLSEARGFRPEDFAVFHPGGSLGRRLLTRVADVMDKGRLPVCTPDASFAEIIDTVSSGRMGLVLVMENDELKGIITDGDIRRAFGRDQKFLQRTAGELMTENPKTIPADMRFAEAEEYMHQAKVGALVVLDKQGKVAGILHMHHRPDA